VKGAKSSAKHITRTTYQEIAMSTHSCPQCSLPVTGHDRFTLSTTSGEPIEHVRISCPASHHFLMARDGLTETTPIAEVAALAPVTVGAR